jgi:hypothetical protein
MATGENTQGILEAATLRSRNVSLIRIGHVVFEDTMTDWIQLIRAEYHEIPGLHLTKAQVTRLWNLESTMCDAVLEALEGARFFRRTHTGAYVKA